jgi:glutamyl-tRNA synthetase
MSASGCLFDLVKLNDISKNVISVMSAETVYNLVTDWAKAYDSELYALLTANCDKAKAILNIDRENPKPRKDIAKWSEVRDYINYMYPELYKENLELPENIAYGDAAAIIEEYKKVFDINDDKQQWFDRIKALCEPLGFTPNVKEYKQNPDAYKGHVGDVSTVIRVALTGRTNTPDLHAIIGVLGREEVITRLDRAEKHFKEGK